MIRRILVTAIGGDVAHSVLKCLHRESAFILGCDIVKYPVALDCVDSFFIAKSATDKSYVADILEKCKLHRITHIIPTNEKEIQVLAKSRELINKNNIKILINNNQVIDTFLDKYKTCLFLRSLKIGVPNFYRIKDKLPVGKKYILKLNNSNGSKLLKIFEDELEIKDLNGFQDNELLIQEYIDSPEEEYTVGVFSNGEQINVISFKRKLQNGFTKFVELIEDEDIVKDAIIIARSVNLIGSINIQLRKYLGMSYIFEINPRLSGTTNFRRQLGFDDVNWWLDTIDGIKVDKFVVEYKSAIGIREMNEKFLIKVHK